MADKVRITPYIDREVFEHIELIHRERRKTDKMMRLSTVVNEALKLYLELEDSWHVDKRISLDQLENDLAYGFSYKLTKDEIVRTIKEYEHARNKSKRDSSATDR
jgi:hypothetical protein